MAATVYQPQQNQGIASACMNINAAKNTLITNLWKCLFSAADIPIIHDIKFKYDVYVHPTLKDCKIKYVLALKTKFIWWGWCLSSRCRRQVESEP